MATRFGRTDVPPPPLVRTSWSTWIWIGLALIVALLSAFGLWYAAQPYML